MHFKVRPRFCIIVICLMLCVFSVSLTLSCRDLNCAKMQLDEACARRADLAGEIESLEKDLNYARTDDYVMRVARDELGLILPGEIRYVSES